MQAIISKKIQLIDAFCCHNLSNFIRLIIQIMPYKGMSPSRFYLCEYENIRFLTKVCFYDKSYHEIHVKDKSMHSFDAEIYIMEDFKKTIIYSNISPHIIELVYYKKCKLLELAPKDEECTSLYSSTVINSLEEDLYDVMCRHKYLVKQDLAYNTCAFLILEQCTMTLDQFLRKTSIGIIIPIVRTLLFQVIYTLRRIQLIYPKFRHYDLHSDNILLLLDQNYEFDVHAPRFILYNCPIKIDKTKKDQQPIKDKKGDMTPTKDDNLEIVEYAVPYFGILAKIIDFGNSALPEKNIYSAKSQDLRQAYERSQIDILLLFHWIYTTAVVGTHNTDIANMLEKLDPTKSYILYNTEHIASIYDQIPTLDDMLSNPIFDRYKDKNISLEFVYNTYG